MAAPPPTPSEAVTAVPAAAEQQALDATYKGGDAPYEVSKVSPCILAVLTILNIHNTASNFSKNMVTF